MVNERHWSVGTCPFDMVSYDGSPHPICLSFKLSSLKIPPWISSQLKNSLLSAEHRILNPSYSPSLLRNLHYIPTPERERSSRETDIYFVIKVYPQNYHTCIIFGSQAILVPGRWNSLSRNAQLSGNIMLLASKQTTPPTHKPARHRERSFLRREFKPLIFLLKGHSFSSAARLLYKW